MTSIAVIIVIIVKMTVIVVNIIVLVVNVDGVIMVITFVAMVGSVAVVAITASCSLAEWFVVGVFLGGLMINIKYCLTLIVPIPKGGRGCLMSPHCLESQGCHLIPLCYLLSSSSA